MLLVDGGIMSLRVDSIGETDVECTVVDGGLMGSRWVVGVGACLGFGGAEGVGVVECTVVDGGMLGSRCLGRSVWWELA